jgi:putative transposase
VDFDIRDQVVDYINHWTTRTEISKRRMLMVLGLNPGKFYDWVKRYGKKNAHNGYIPRGFWITESEKQAVVEYYNEHKEDGYRSITYQMMDKNIVAMSPATVYRILTAEGVMRSKSSRSSNKGEGFEQPLDVHEHWHTDISYVKIKKRFYFFIGVLDGCSRNILHWEIREQMTEQDAMIVVQRALEKHPGVTPRVITDNGAQYTSKEFKTFIGLHGLTHVRTSPYYPQSNGKIERFHYSLKNGAVRPGCPTTREEAESIIGRFVNYYNNERLHSAIGYVTPADRLKGKHKVIFRDRERKLTEARSRRLLLSEQSLEQVS